jgi:hypothetical protein
VVRCKRCSDDVVPVIGSLETRMIERSVCLLVLAAALAARARAQQFELPTKAKGCTIQ